MSIQADKSTLPAGNWPVKITFSVKKNKSIPQSEPNFNLAIKIGTTSMADISYSKGGSIPSGLMALITIYMSTFPKFISPAQASLLNSGHMCPIPVLSFSYCSQKELSCSTGHTSQSNKQARQHILVPYFTMKISLQWSDPDLPNELLGRAGSAAPNSQLGTWNPFFPWTPSRGGAHSWQGTERSQKN